MVQARDFKTAIPNALSEKEAETFEKGLALLKKDIVARGYSQKAVDALNIELSSYTIPPLTDGGFHKRANGEPFYTLRVQTEGSWFEMDLPKGVPFTQLNDKLQSMVLAFEIGMNMFGNMGRYLHALNPTLFEDDCAGGSGGPAGIFDIETSFQRVDITTYMNTLRQALSYRLDDLAHEQNQAPKPPQGPAPKF